MLYHIESLHIAHICVFPKILTKLAKPSLRISVQSLNILCTMYDVKFNLSNQLFMHQNKKKIDFS